MLIDECLLLDCSIVWGAVLMLTATAFNIKGLIAVRFFLGVTEAAIAPGLSIVISMWYERSEQPFRHGIWFQGITVPRIFGGLVCVRYWSCANDFPMEGKK
jgi:MFS family permease